jgi:hypothetical protein
MKSWHEVRHACRVWPNGPEVIVVDACAASLLTGTPLKRITQLTVADLAALGFRTSLTPVMLLDALADNPHERTPS